MVISIAKWLLTHAIIVDEARLDRTVSNDTDMIAISSRIINYRNRHMQPTAHIGE